MSREDFEIFGILRSEAQCHGEYRRRVARDDFRAAQRRAKALGLTLEQKSEIHYQLIGPKYNPWILNLYPGNNRIYHDSQRPKAPYIPLSSRRWTLDDVLDAISPLCNQEPTMPVATFSKADFESALPHLKANPSQPAWKPLGLIEDEWAYLVPIKGLVGIHVRSSVGPNGYSADCGEDSIRLWLVNTQTGKPIASKLDRWTTRVPGWNRRMMDKLRELAAIGVNLVTCPACGHGPIHAYKVKKEGPNKGRLFRSHSDRDGGCGFFEFLDPEPTHAKSQERR